MTDHTTPPEPPTCDECGAYIRRVVYEFKQALGGGVNPDEVLACDCTTAWTLTTADGTDIWPECWPEPTDPDA